MALVLYHDYTNPASAIAVARLQRLADEGIAVEFVGFDAFGVDVALPVTVDVKAALDDLAPVAAAEGVALREPSLLPPTGWAHALEVLAERVGRGADWRAMCYAAFWVQGTDLSRHDDLRLLASLAGLPGTAVDEVLGDRTHLAAVRRASAAQRANGVGGVPTLLAQRTLVPGLLDEADLRALAALG